MQWKKNVERQAEEFIENHDDAREAAERLRQAEEFIENVKSPTTASELAKLCPADLRYCHPQFHCRST